jgi:thiol-disulfide isomerase/thioredoxin
MALMCAAATVRFFKRGTDVEIYPDMSEDGRLKINFNVTFPAVSCEFLEVGVQDVIGHRRANVTGTVKKLTENSMGQWVEMHSKAGVLEEIQSQPDDHFMEGLVKHAGEEEDTLSKPMRGGDHDYDYEPIKEVDLKWIYDRKVIPDANRKERDGLYKSVKFTREWLEDSEGVMDEYGEHEAAVEITPTNYKALAMHFPLLILDFHAPWCSHCRAFAPTYEAVSYIFNIAPHVPDMEKAGHNKGQHAEQIPQMPAVMDESQYQTSTMKFLSQNEFPVNQKMLFGQVNCFKYADFCQEHGVAGYPSVRVIRDGKDSVKDGMYEAYEGPRTVKDMVVFFTHLAKEVIGLDFFSMDRDEARRRGYKPHEPARAHPTDREPGRKGVEVGENRPGVLYRMNGCTIVGHVSGRRVPGILRFSLEGDSSFDARAVNMSHVIHHFSFGPRLDDKWHKYLLKYNQAHPRKEERLPQVGWRYEQTFTSERPFMTYEHFARVVSTTFKYLNGVDFPAYEFSVSSNSFTHGKETVEADPSEHERALPSVAFRYDLSPLQIFITETRMGLGLYVVVLCAIIGGVYTIAGILDSVLLTGHQVVKKIRKKE